MKFLADENIDQEIIERLREDGHEVLAIAEMASGLSVRLAGLSARSKADIVGLAIRKYRDELLNNFSVISPMNVRIRSSTKPA